MVPIRRHAGRWGAYVAAGIALAVALPEHGEAQPKAKTPEAQKSAASYEPKSNAPPIVINIGDSSQSDDKSATETRDADQQAADGHTLVFITAILAGLAFVQWLAMF